MRHVNQMINVRVTDVTVVNAKDLMPMSIVIIIQCVMLGIFALIKNAHLNLTQVINVIMIICVKQMKGAIKDNAFLIIV